MIEIIPPGSSAVVTHKHDDYRHHYRNHDVEIMEAVKDAEADLERSEGQHFGDTMVAIKDAEANLQCSVKDTEADLERSSGLHYADTVKTIKDVEAQLERGSSDRFMQTLENVKQVEVATEKAKAKILEAVREEGGETRELTAFGFKDMELELCKGVDNVKDSIQDARRELMYSQLTSCKDTLLEFKNTQNLARQLAAEADKTACQNQTQTLLQFKEQALLSERLACQASKELAAQSCDIKELVRAEAQATRALVNSIEQDRLRERASRAEAALNAYFARGVSPVTPI